MDNPAKFREGSMARSCISKIEIFGILVCSLQTRPDISKFVFDFVPPYGYQKVAKIHSPTWSRFRDLRGCFQPPDTIKLPEKADAILIVKKTVKKKVNSEKGAIKKRSVYPNLYKCGFLRKKLPWKCSIFFCPTHFLAPPLFIDFSVFRPLFVFIKTVGGGSGVIFASETYLKVLNPAEWKLFTELR